MYNDQAEAEIQQEVEEIQVEVDVLSDPGSDSPLGFSSEEASQTPWSYIGATEEVVRTPWTVPILREPPPVAIPSLNEERHLYFYQSTLPLIADFDENQTLDFHASVLESIRRVRSGKQPVNLVQTPQPAYILAIAQPQVRLVLFMFFLTSVCVCVIRRSYLHDLVYCLWDALCFI